MSPDKPAPAVKVVGWAAPRNQRRSSRDGAVYQRPNFKETVFGKMLAIETMPLCAIHVQDKKC